MEPVDRDEIFENDEYEEGVRSETIYGRPINRDEESEGSNLDLDPENLEPQTEAFSPEVLSFQNIQPSVSNLFPNIYFFHSISILAADKKTKEERKLVKLEQDIEAAKNIANNIFTWLENTAETVEEVLNRLNSELSFTQLQQRSNGSYVILHSRKKLSALKSGTDSPEKIKNWRKLENKETHEGIEKLNYCRKLIFKELSNNPAFIKRLAKVAGTAPKSTLDPSLERDTFLHALRQDKKNGFNYFLTKEAIRNENSFAATLVKVKSNGSSYGMTQTQRIVEKMGIADKIFSLFRPVYKLLPGTKTSKELDIKKIINKIHARANKIESSQGWFKEKGDSRNSRRKINALRDLAEKISAEVLRPELESSIEYAAKRALNIETANATEEIDNAFRTGGTDAAKIVLEKFEAIASEAKNNIAASEDEISRNIAEKNARKAELVAASVKQTFEKLTNSNSNVKTTETTAEKLSRIIDEWESEVTKPAKNKKTNVQVMQYHRARFCGMFSLTMNKNSPTKSIKMLLDIEHEIKPTYKPGG